MCSPHNGNKRRLLRTGRAATRAAAVVSGVCGLLAACEISAPETHDLYWQRVMFEDLELSRTYETLTLFARVWDADGIEDLDALFVMHDRAQLFWRLSAEDWVVDRSESGVPWIGSTALTMPEGEALPAGVYRVIVQDIAGQTAELRFQVTESANAAARRLAAAIDATIVDEELTVTGPFAEYELWIYRSVGTRLAAAPFVDHIDVQAVLPAGVSDTEMLLYVFAAPKDDAICYLSGPYLWKRP